MELRQLAILGWRFIAALTLINYGLSFVTVVLNAIVRFSEPGFWPIVTPIIGIATGLVIYRKSRTLGEWITDDV